MKLQKCSVFWDTRTHKSNTRYRHSPTTIILQLSEKHKNDTRPGAPLLKQKLICQFPEKRGNCLSLSPNDTKKGGCWGMAHTCVLIDMVTEGEAHNDTKVWLSTHIVYNKAITWSLYKKWWEMHLAGIFTLRPPTDTPAECVADKVKKGRREIPPHTK